jgi:hypothetical protein
MPRCVPIASRLPDTNDQLLPLLSTRPQPSVGIEAPQRLVVITKS